MFKVEITKHYKGTPSEMVNYITSAIGDANKCSENLEIKAEIGGEDKDASIYIADIFEAGSEAKLFASRLTNDAEAHHIEVTCGECEQIDLSMAMESMLNCNQRTWQPIDAKPEKEMPPVVPPKSRPKI